MDKCEWKDGEFVCCEKFKRNIIAKPLRDGTLVIKQKDCPAHTLMYFCPFCGADIRKPEPEVIIKQSCGTWVAQYDGVDYLCTDGKRSGDLEGDFTTDHIERWWEPISEIEITDEIAKLRPYIVCCCGCGQSSILYGVSDELKAFRYLAFDNSHKNYAGWAKVRIATVADLEEPNA